MPGLDEPVDSGLRKTLPEGCDRRKGVHQIAYGAQADDEYARSHVEEVSFCGGAESKSSGPSRLFESGSR
jgi:hypothetical protein